MVNIEHQATPMVVPEAGWIEVDHSSANVGHRTEIDALVEEHFDVIVDPSDEANVWISPKAGTVVLGIIAKDDDRVVYLLEVPDGHDTRLVYEYTYGTGLGDESYSVRLESDPQMVFRLFGTSK